MLMINSTQKEFKVSRCFSPIQVRPHEAVSQPIKFWSEKFWKQKSFRVREPKHHDLLSSFIEIILPFEYITFVSFDA